MSAQIIDIFDGIITVEITGKISPAQHAANQAEILNCLREWGGGAILVICENFEGFTGGDWAGLSFPIDADPLIRKMAIIGEKQWEHMALTFTAKGHRPFFIEFFETGHLREANAWLKS